MLRTITHVPAARAFLAAWVGWVSLGESIGFLAPVMFQQLGSQAAALQLAVGLLTGLVLLASIGVAQWLELRRHIPHSWPWIPGTAAAWSVGLVIFLAISTPLWQPGQPPTLIALIGVLAGIAMAVGMAAVTGLVLLRMLFSETDQSP